MSHTHRINIASDREELKQQKLTDMFISKTKSIMPAGTHHDERFILARRLSLWIARDLLPFSLVENKGFSDFWNSLHLSIPLPSRKTIAVSAVDDMYDCMKNELIRAVSSNGGKENSFFSHLK